LLVRAAAADDGFEEHLAVFADIKIVNSVFVTLFGDIVQDFGTHEEIDVLFIVVGEGEG
jgi:hypothetical protein